METNEKEKMQLTGTITQVIYRNEANGYTVMELMTDQGEELTAVGYSPMLGQGERVQLEGVFTMHREYGRQFQAAVCRPMLPETTEELERFLASGLIRGCGPATARAIIQVFGEETANILQNAPGKLLKVPGIGPVTAEKIAVSYAENMQLRKVIAGLSEYGITVSQAIRIAAEYGEDAVLRVKENPYRLSDDIFGIGFKTADAIAQKMGIEAEAPFRMEAGLRYALQLAAGEGHMYLPSDILIPFTAKQLRTSTQSVQRAALRMLQTGVLRLGEGEREPVYLAGYYRAEQECAKRFYALAQADLMPLCTDVQRDLEQRQKESHIYLAEQQKAAVETAVHAPISIITGGPGTGKTTIVQFLLTLFERAGLDVALCAPTGRAAKRMEQATGRQAHTIHRLLEYGRGEENEEIYGKDEDNPLETDVVIVDEMSMVDTFLMWHLLRAIPQGMRVVLIGDIDQLPSVGPGHVLHDLIESALFPVTALDTIFRQGEGSAISLNARRINRGEMPSPGQGFEMWQAENPEQVWRCLQTLCKDGDWQVITPMKKGESGVIALNGKLQALINPADRKKPQFARFGQMFRLGDQVMQIRNDYQQPWTKDNGTDLEHGKGVFNGELGVIVKINPEAELFTVQFDDDRISDYDFAQAEEMTLSYAISIHKSQGSEFDRVAIALLGGTPMLYNRNLLYTAVTRAKKQVVLIGRKAVVQQMINNNRTKQRYSGLTAALQEAKQSK